MVKYTVYSHTYTQKKNNTKAPLSGTDDPMLDRISKISKDVVKCINLAK